MADSPAGSDEGDRQPAGLVLAAGSGERFGATKQLAELDGRPLLEHALAAMAAASVKRFVVVLGAAAAEVHAGVDLHGAEPVVCEQWSLGQSASLRTGVAALAGAEAVVVTLGDQPMISAQAIDRVVAARRPGKVAVRASYGGLPGHPVLLEENLLAEVDGLRGDSGARDLLEGGRIATVPCDGLGDPLDVDTPDRLEVLRRRSGSESG